MNTEIPSPKSSNDRSEVPLEISLQALALELPSGREKRELLRVAHLLSQGKSIDSLSGRDAHSPLVETLKSGIESGKPAQVLAEYIESGRSIRELRRRLWFGLLYPIVLLLLTAGLLGLFITLCATTVESIYAGLSMEIPRHMQVLFWLGHIPINYGVSILVGILLVILSLLIFVITGGSVSALRGLRFIPLLGPAFRFAGAAEFCSRLTVFIDAQVPLPRAFELLSRSLHSQSLRKTCRHLTEQLQRGVPTVSAVEKESLLPSSVSVLFHHEESPANLADGLRLQSQSFLTQSQLCISVFHFLSQPFLFLLLGTSIGTLLYAFFAPLVSLLNSMS